MEEKVNVGDLVKYKWQRDWGWSGKRDWNRRFDKYYGLVISELINGKGEQIVLIKFNDGTRRAKRIEVEVVAKHR